MLVADCLRIVIVAGMVRAFNDSMDVLTLSLGGPSGWSESTSAVVASRIAASGRVVTIAAGKKLVKYARAS